MGKEVARLMFSQSGRGSAGVCLHSTVAWVLCEGALQQTEREKKRGSEREKKKRKENREESGPHKTQFQVPGTRYLDVIPTLLKF